MTDERLPQRFRYRLGGADHWLYATCLSSVDGDRRYWWCVGQWFHFTFECDPWEALERHLGVTWCEWIDNDYGWRGDLMPAKERT